MHTEINKNSNIFFFIYKSSARVSSIFSPLIWGFEAVLDDLVAVGFRGFIETSKRAPIFCSRRS